ncbi:MAG: tRNA (adenosine(37)-N6)-threonylcarbamoyltransferase complex ATPase subunit type 1 TsaE [Burkholderiaceae bacterium]
MVRHAALDDACIELHGPLGAGKTTFVRHLLHALGVPGRIKSPTYALMEPYELARPQGVLHIWHFDFYRFEDPQELEDAGFRELYATPGLKLAEWPEQAAGLLPPADLRIHIEPLEPARRDDVGLAAQSNEPRHVRLEARSARGLELLA